MPNRRFWGMVLILFAVGLGLTTYERVRSVHWYVLPERDKEAERAAVYYANANAARLEAMQKTWPRANWRYCMSQSDSAPRIGEEAFLRDAEKTYRNPAQRANGAARLVLYRTALTVNADRVQSWRDNIVRGDSAFAAFIDEGIAFVERFCALPDGEAMRRAAYAYVDDGRFTPNGGLRDTILMIASSFGSPAARFESAARELEEQSTYAVWSTIVTSAMHGHLPAQLFMAKAYLSGDQLRRNEFKAAYWYARARLSGAPVDERFEAIGETLNLDQRFKIQTGIEFSSGSFIVQEDEVLSGIRF